MRDPAPLVEAEVPDLPPPLFLTNGTLLLSFPWLTRDPHVIRARALPSELRKPVVSNERLASLQEGVVFRLWCAHQAKTKYLLVWRPRITGFRRMEELASVVIKAAETAKVISSSHRSVGNERILTPGMAVLAGAQYSL